MNILINEFHDKKKRRRVFTGTYMNIISTTVSDEDFEAADSQKIARELAHGAIHFGMQQKFLSDLFSLILHAKPSSAFLYGREIKVFQTPYLPETMAALDPEVDKEKLPPELRYLSLLILHPAVYSNLLRETNFTGVFP